MGKWKILVVAASNDLGDFLSIFLNKRGFDANVVDTTRHIKEKYVKIYAELSRKKYDMVLLTTSCLRSGDIRALIPEIKKKHPAIKIFVMPSYASSEFIKNVEGIDEFLTMPFKVEDLVERVTSIFDQENRIKEAQEEEEEIEEEEDEGNSYGRKMPIRQVLLELERDGIIQFYEDRWGKVQFRITGGWS
jgi:DNA-binding NtrC family response regulator